MNNYDISFFIGFVKMTKVILAKQKCEPKSKIASLFHENYQGKIKETTQL